MTTGPTRLFDAFRKTVAVLRQDWRAWSGLARSLRRTARDAEARQAAETVSRIREVLDPMSLGPSLAAAFRHLDDPAALRDLAELVGRAGLTRLSDAWRSQGPSRRRWFPVIGRWAMLDRYRTPRITTMPTPVSDRSSPSPSRRVLVVEPSGWRRARLRDELTAAHLEVHEAGDLVTAEQAVSTFQPDVILAQLP